MGEARNLGARIQVRRETKRKAALGALFLGRGMQKGMPGDGTEQRTGAARVYQESSRARSGV